MREGFDIVQGQEQFRCDRHSDRGVPRELYTMPEIAQYAGEAKAALKAELEVNSDSTGNDQVTIEVDPDMSNDHDERKYGARWPSRQILGIQNAPAWARHRCDCQSVPNGYLSCFRCKGEPAENSWEGMVPGAEWVWTDRTASKIGDRGHWTEPPASAVAMCRGAPLDDRTCYICNEKFNIFSNADRTRSDLCDKSGCRIRHAGWLDRVDHTPKDDKASAHSVL
jgi:hypothetical protein